MKNTRLLLSIAAVSGGLIFSGATRAEDWKPVGQYGWLGVGKANEIEKGHFYWVGEYAGIFFNDKGEKSLFDRAGVKCPAWSDQDFNNKRGKAGGYCIWTDLDGDQAYETWQAAGVPGPGSPWPGTGEWTGGTGKYKNIKGSASPFAGVTQINWSDGTTSGYAILNR